MRRALGCAFVALVGCHSSSSEGSGQPPPATHLCAAFGAPAPPAPPTTCPITVGGSGKSVRVFAVGNEQNVTTNVDYARWCDAIDRLVRTEVAPCLSSDAPNLVVFPEDTLLAAGFIGPRGEKARSQATSQLAFLDLAGGHDKAISYYQNEFGALPSGRELELALTDVSWRLLNGVFSEMARRYGVYVAVSGNVAQARQTVDDYAIQRLGDAQAAGPTYEATTSDVWNASIVFAPDGTLVGFEKKAYLVPDEETTLSLSYGPLDALDPIDLPFARVGVAISKDAWMPLVRDRFDAWGVDVVLQHEAFSGWGIEELPGDWLPDVFMQSGWTMTQRAGATRAVVAPMLTGNLFDLVFDGQSHVTKLPAIDDAPLGFIGEPPTNGFFTVGPWADTTDDARDALRDYAKSLLPGGSREDQYVESVVAADLEIHRDGMYPPPHETGAPTVPGVFGPSIALSATPAPQRHVALTARTTHAFVAWEEGPPGGGSIRAASFDGSTFVAPTTIVASSVGGARLPSIGIYGAGDESAVAAWEEDDGVRVATFDTHGWGAPIAVPSAGAKQWAPSIAGTRFNGVFVAWHDLRDGGRSHVYVAHAGTSAPASAVRVDPSHVDATPRGDEWGARMLADDRAVHVAWIDFREFSWDVRYARSIDGGATFVAQERVNDPTTKVGDPPVELERLESDPVLALDLAGAPVVAWTALQERKPTPWVAYEEIAASGPNVVVGSGAPMVQPSIAVDGAGKVHVVAVWNGRIVIDDPTNVVSDAPQGAHCTRPRVTIVGDNTVIVAWEDDRRGATAIRYVVGTL